MLHIREGIFETNSSSTHALALAKEADYMNHPNVVYFEQGDFGWDDAEVSPADYLYTYILTQVEGWYDETVAAEEIIDNYYIRQIDSLLGKFGIRCVFDGYEVDRYSGPRCVKITGYIDHQSSNMLSPIFESLMSDERLLYRYLFASHVYTGNDNAGNYLGHPLRKCLCGQRTVGCWEMDDYKHQEEVENHSYDPEHFEYYS